MLLGATGIVVAATAVGTATGIALRTVIGTVALKYRVSPAAVCSNVYYHSLLQRCLLKK